MIQVRRGKRERRAPVWGRKGTTKKKERDGKGRERAERLVRVYNPSLGSDRAVV